MAAPKNPPTKYSEAKVKIILGTIRATGSVKAAWKAAGISKATYYRWANERPSLVSNVSKAFEDFQLNVEAEQREAALAALDRYLHGKQKVISRYKVEKEEDIIDKETGVATGEKKVTKEDRDVEVTVAPPQWVIERILGRRLPLNDAIATFREYGYTVTKLDNGFLITDGGSDESSPAGG